METSTTERKVAPEGVLLGSTPKPPESTVARRDDAVQRPALDSAMLDSRARATDALKKSDRAAPRSRHRLWQAARILGGILVISVAGAFWFDRYFDLQSSHAMLSARTFTLRASIEGELSSLPHGVGEIVPTGEILATIHNPRVNDRSESTLAASLIVAEREAQALNERRRALDMRIQETQQNAANFISARRTQLAAQLGAEEAAITGAQARAHEAATALRRAQTLFAAGFASRANLDQARREQDVTQSDLTAAQQRREMAASILAAAASGVFGSDNASDRSISQQALDQFHSLDDELRVQRATLEARIEGLKSELSTERSRLAQQRDLTLSAPAQVRILQVLAAPGEYMRAGQEIAILADCRQPIATATVNEGVFRSLRLGMSARFTAIGDAEWRGGRIVELVPPGSGSLPSYGVLLRLDSPRADEGCEVGRLGSVHFGI
jgi:multidrug resistance efflux pump